MRKQVEKSDGASRTARKVKEASVHVLAEQSDSADRRSGIVGSLAKGLQILEYVTSSPSKVRLRSIATHFNMDRSAAFRFLATLERFEYISKDAETKAYSPGPGLARLRRLARPRSELIELTSPFLNRISDLTGQTGYLAMLENDRALLLEVTPGRGIVSVRHYVGQLEPLYCTSVGKAILAMLPAEEQNDILRGLVLKRLTPHTIVSKRALRDQLTEIRESGIAFDECEWREEICCIGAPILDETGYPIAAVGVSMVDALVKGGPRALTEWIEVVRDAAADAGLALAGAYHPEGEHVPAPPPRSKLTKVPQ